MTAPEIAREIARLFVQLADALDRPAPNPDPVQEWAIDADGTLVRNGARLAGTFATRLVTRDGMVYHLGRSGQWWVYNGTGFDRAESPDPTVTGGARITVGD